MSVQWRASCRDSRGTLGKTERIHFEGQGGGVVGNGIREVREDDADMTRRGGGKAPSGSEFITKLPEWSTQNGGCV